MWQAIFLPGGFRGRVIREAQKAGQPVFTRKNICGNQYLTAY
jgi:hypothetical protein